VALHLGVRTELPGQQHHTISFGAAWRDVFDELTRTRRAPGGGPGARRGKIMTDPSLLISMPSVTDRSLAPEGGQVLSVVAPTPNLDRRSGGNPDLDWAQLGPRYRDELLATLEARGWTGLTGAIEVEELTTPAGWAAQGMAAGTPFALAHTFGQTGPFRPSTLPRRGPENVVLAGSSVQPGVGVPMVLLSGRLAAERITGPVPR
jgi:phytoene desaturase